MIIVQRKVLNEFSRTYDDVSDQVSAFIKELERAKWKNPNHLKERFPKASILGNKCYVFDLKGNKYRVVVKINYKKQIVQIKWAGLHKEYDKINVKEDLC
ncbi:MAG: type II toxin-antitoxin system HigB family toxin [Candidatus Cloacimonetes bacterium]|nr:type II toxin-antitoxin system HigB family toxin [Candidatus Cloacimonadota bacterium]